jgi:hypothetical protein
MAHEGYVTAPSAPVADQRVPHISPVFGEMWETRTSTPKFLPITCLAKRRWSRRVDAGRSALLP